MQEMRKSLKATFITRAEQKPLFNGSNRSKQALHDKTINIIGEKRRRNSRSRHANGMTVTMKIHYVLPITFPNATVARIWRVFAGR